VEELSGSLKQKHLEVVRGWIEGLESKYRHHLHILKMKSKIHLYKAGVYMLDKNNNETYFLLKKQFPLSHHSKYLLLVPPSCL
jgi:hypothetical protein